MGQQDNIKSTLWLYDVTRDCLLIGTNLESKRHISSLTKLMTAMVILDSGLSLTEHLPLAQAHSEPWEHTKNTLTLGEHYTVYELLIALMLSSNNAAATTLANHYGHNAFIEAMNNKAKSLGMDNTEFVNPTGANGNWSTASDVHIMLLESAKYAPIITINQFKSFITKNTTLDNISQIYKNKIDNVVIAKSGKDMNMSSSVGLYIANTSKTYTAIILGADGIHSIGNTLSKFQKITGELKLHAN